MSADHENVGDFCEDISAVFLLGTDNKCKCLVGNKLVKFEHFLPDRSTYGEVSLEIGHHWVTVINMDESQSSAKIQEYRGLSCRSQCMTVFVLRSDHVSQRDVDIFTSFQQRFEDIVLLLVIIENKKSAKPNSLTNENLKMILSHCQRKVCFFNKNMEQSDLIKKLMNCWKIVPEQVNKHERSHMTTFEKNETLQPQETQEHISRGDQTAITKKNTVTILLLGQTGSGKSATGNTILGKQRFASHVSSVPVTQECQMKEKTIGGIKFRVIDTPDFFHESLKKQEKQIKRCKELIQPGPDVYLLVMELGRFTDGEREIVDGIQRVFGEEVVRETIILFTGKEKLRGKSLSEYIKNTNPELQQLIQTCGSRCLAFNNNDPDNRQVKRLMEMILEIKGKNGNADFLKHHPLYKEKRDCRVQ